MTQQATPAHETTRVTQKEARLTEKFVRYSPGLERDDPNFKQNLETVIDDMRQQMRASPKQDGMGRVLRNAHATGYGLARGEVEILPGLPEEYAQGIYATPGRH